MKKTTLLSLAFLLICMILSSKSMAQTNESLADSFFKDFKEKKYDIAIKNLFKTNKFLEKSDFSKIVAKFKAYDDILGKYKGKEIIKSKKVGKSVITNIYMLRYERQPVRLLLTFYKSENKWMIFNLNIADKLIEEVEDSVIKSLHYE